MNPMTTETPPVDPAIDVWSDRLEQDLAEAGMEAEQARAYARAFEFGMTRVLSVMATKQELKDGLADLRDQLQREMELRFTELQRDIDHRFDAVNQRFDALSGSVNERFDALSGSVNERFDGVNERFDGVNERFVSVNERFAELNARLDRMERRFLLWGGGVLGLLVALVVRAFT